MKMRKINKVTAALLTMVLAAGMTACTSSDSGSADTEAAETEAAETGAETEAAAETTAEGDLVELDVVLDWYPNAIHEFLYDAADKGYFAEEGLKVNLIDPAESVDGINFVATGRAQIGLTYPVEVCQAQENNMPVKALAAVCQTELDCLCSLADNTDITEDMSSLKGHKIGYSGTAGEEAILKTITKNAGLTEDDYELVNVGFDLTTALTTESVDLVGGTFINDEVITMEQAGYDVNVYDESDYGVPQLYGLIMAVNSEDYDARPEVYEGFLNACKKGFEDMKSDEDAALDVIMNEMSSDENPLDEEQQRGSYEVLMERMETADGEFLSMSEDVWQDCIDWMTEYSLITKELTPEDVMIQR